MLKQAFNSNYESDAILLSKAAKIFREDIFNMDGFHFNGSFPPGCQQESVPTNLKYLVSMLLNGPNLRDQDSTDSQTCLTISQTIVFNCKKRGSTVANKSRHSLDYEPPLPLYIGMNVHTQTRSKKLITQLCQMGLNVSYDRILQLENQLATSVCEITKEIGLVCPIQLRHVFFTVGALDNLDNKLEKGDAVSWASYHASNQIICEDTPTTLTQVMPLFYEKSASAAMVKHGMDVQRQATEFLNPGQIPVTAVFAPVFALAKLVQWKWPNTHGEDKYVVMMGGLHIEMAIWSTIGDYLEASGWTTALTQVGVASSGTADSFLKASHLIANQTRLSNQCIGSGKAPRRCLPVY